MTRVEWALSPNNTNIKRDSFSSKKASTVERAAPTTSHKGEDFFFHEALDGEQALQPRWVHEVCPEWRTLPHTLRKKATMPP